MVLQAYCWVLCITSEEFPYVMQLYAMVIHTTPATELCCIYLYGDILPIVFFIDWSVQMIHTTAVRSISNGSTMMTSATAAIYTSVNDHRYKRVNDCGCKRINNMTTGTKGS